MKFNDILNNYIETIGCTSKELVETSGISSAVISRYRKGDRIPKYNSEKLEALIKALVQLAKEKNIDINEDKIRKDLELNINKNEIDFEIFRNNFNTLINELNINVADMAKYVGYDSSFISKIRSGIRKPLNTKDFTNTICKYVINKYSNTHNELIKALIKYDNVNLENDLEKQLYFWLTHNKQLEEEYKIDDFLKKLDDFDLNDYIKAIKFDKIKVPTLPKGISKSKTYYGLEGFKNSQIDVLKSIVLSKSKEDVFFYSNMSMIEASKDLDFTKKFMIGLAFMLKKGLKLNIVHNLDRPFKELMLGLEGWLPLYMTGQINPYYFKNNSNMIFSQIECVGGSAALSGSSITGHINKAKLIVTTKKEEVEYYKENAKILLKKASPLMEIYTLQNKNKFIEFLSNSNLNGNRKNILTNLPNYALTDELLNKILDNNNVSKKDKELIIKGVHKEKEIFFKTLENNKFFDEINILSKDEFEQSNYCLSLSKMFYDKELLYTYEDYLKHLNLIKELKNKYSNYDFKTNNSNAFKNINISIIENKQVIISKEKAPTIHFVIHHPKLVKAISNFKVIMKE